MDPPKRDALYWLKDEILEDLKEFGEVSESWYSSEDQHLIPLAIAELHASGLIEVHKTQYKVMYVDANRQRALKNILIGELFSNPLALEDSDVVGTRPYFMADEIYQAAQDLERQGKLEIHNSGSPRRFYLLPEATRRRMLEDMIMDFENMN